MSPTDPGADPALDFAAAVAALITHDLASPIAAAAAALETAEDEDARPDFKAEALESGAESMRRASATLEFLRAAYGPTAEGAGAIAALAAAAAEVGAGKSVSVDWPVAATPTPVAARCAALAVHGLFDPAHGGAVSLRAADGGVVVTARGPRINRFARPEGGPRSAPWRALKRLAAAAQWRLAVAVEMERVAICLSPTDL